MKKILILVILMFSELAISGAVGFVPGVHHFGTKDENTLLNERNNMIFYETKNNYRFLYFKNSFYEKSIGMGRRFALYQNSKINVSLSLGVILGYRECYTEKYFSKSKSTVFNVIKNKDNMVCTINLLKEMGLPYKDYNSTDYIIQPMIVPEFIYQLSNKLSVHSFLFVNSVGLGLSYSL